MKHISHYLIRSLKEEKPFQVLHKAMNCSRLRSHGSPCFRLRNTLKNEREAFARLNMKWNWMMKERKILIPFVWLKICNSETTRFTSVWCFQQFHKFSQKNMFRLAFKKRIIFWNLDSGIKLQEFKNLIHDFNMAFVTPLVCFWNKILVYTLRSIYSMVQYHPLRS